MFKNSRLANLFRLTFVPNPAIRKLLYAYAPEGESHTKWDKVRREDLIRSVDANERIDEVAVEEAYEFFRYGRRLSFQLFLLQTPTEATLTLTGVQEFLQKIVAALEEITAHEAAASDDTDLPGAAEEGAGQELEKTRSAVTICDVEDIGEYREIRYKYLVEHHYLDQNEEPAYITQTRYGFLWLSVNHRFIVVISQDVHTTGILLKALNNVLGEQPLPVKFDKDLLDEFFPFESARRLTHFDPRNKVRHSISGDNIVSGQYGQEIQLRDDACTRPAAIYAESIPGDDDQVPVSSGLGVSAREGRIYLLKMLPASQVRSWGTERLPQIIRAIRQRSMDEGFNGAPIQSLARASNVIAAIHVADEIKAALFLLCDQILKMRNDGLSTLKSPVNAVIMFEGLGESRAMPFIACSCDSCDERGEYCPSCNESRLERTGQEVSCSQCGRVLSKNGTLRVRCLNGHVTSRSLQLCFGMAPKMGLLKLVAKEMNRRDSAWDREREFFYLEDDMIHYIGAPAGKSIKVIHGDNIEVRSEGDMNGNVIGKYIKASGPTARKGNEDE